MTDKLNEIKNRYAELAMRMSDPELLSNAAEWNKAAKEYADLEKIVVPYNEYNAVMENIEVLRNLERECADGDERTWLLSEIASETARGEELNEKLRMLLLPRDRNDERNVVVEIRAGAGGEEAALFAADLMRMYMRYAETHGFKYEEVNINATELGGIKEAVFVLSGTDAYRNMQFESGVHRVQRVPVTESGGRIHTSTITVAVLPEAQDIDVQINPGDLRIDTYRSSGAGGQHVNKTESAIRITHVPTGVVVASQAQRSQIQNRETAMRMLKSRLYDMYQTQAAGDIAGSRRSQVGTGDRSEKIRTYNYPQGRVTDHRIGLTLYKLEKFLDGDMDEMINALLLEHYNTDE